MAESLLWAAALFAGDDPRRTATWVHWDSYRYIDIARRGYFEDAGAPEASNTGWFPGFPLLVRLTSEPLHVKPARVGRAVALLFELGVLTLMWTRLLPPVSPARRWLALMAAAVFPAFFYRHAVFPLSMTAFFSLAAISCGAAGRFAAAGACAFVAATSYPTGFLVAAPLAAAVALAPGLSAYERGRALVAGPGLTLLGLVTVFGALYATVGRWDAFLAYQERFGQGLFNPVEVLAGHAQPLLRASPDAAALVSLQTALATVLLGLAAGLLWCERQASRPLDGLLLGHAVALWLFVNGAGPNVSVYRQAASLVGLVPLLARLRARGLAVLLAVLLALGAGMACLFFENLLV